MSSSLSREKFTLHPQVTARNFFLNLPGKWLQKTSLLNSLKLSQYNRCHEHTREIDMFQVMQACIKVLSPDALVWRSKPWRKAHSITIRLPSHFGNKLLTETRHFHTESNSSKASQQAAGRQFWLTYPLSIEESSSDQLAIDFKVFWLGDQGDLGKSQDVRFHSFYLQMNFSVLHLLLQ